MQSLRWCGNMIREHCGGKPLKWIPIIPAKLPNSGFRVRRDHHHDLRHGASNNAIRKHQTASLMSDDDDGSATHCV